MGSNPRVLLLLWLASVIVLSLRTGRMVISSPGHSAVQG